MHTKCASICPTLLVLLLTPTSSPFLSLQAPQAGTTRALYSKLGFQTWVHVEGIHVTASLQVTHARKPLSLGLNNLHFSSPELASNCMWADLARNGLNDQLEGKKEFLSLSSRVPVEEPYFPSPARMGPRPALCGAWVYCTFA